VFAVLRGAVRGFVKELLSMASVILGITAAVLFSGAIASYLERYVGSLMWSQIIAFLGIFLVVYLVVKLFENALHRLIEHIHLESLDHALGIFLGLLEGIIVIFVLILIIQVQPFVDADRLLRGSAFARLLVPFLPYASEFLSQRTTNV